MAIVQLNKEVLNKNQYEQVIDTSFTQLIPVPSSTQVAFVPSINEFFNYYNALFFQIPKLGETNSHEYLVKTSGTYVGSSQDDTTIQALMEEITQLRTENLALQKQINDIQQ